MVKLPYSEGDWFGIPLRKGGYAIGLIARTGKKGRLLFGYFFGPKRDRLPEHITEEICQLKPKDAILLGRFGDLGLIQNEWSILGKCCNWQSNEWPMPPFVRVEPISNRCWLDTLEDENLSQIKFSQRIDIKDKDRFPDSGLMGYGAVEIILTKLLG